MGIVESLRQRFVAKRVEKANAVQSNWLGLVTRIADGEDVPFEEIESVVDSENATGAKPRCPTNPQHASVSSTVSGTRLKNVCHDCGQEWTSDRPTDQGEYSIERLQADVELLTRRRGLAAKLATRAKAESDLQGCRERIAAADEKFQAARKAVIDLQQDLSGPIAEAEQVLRGCDQAKTELIQTADKLRPAFAGERAALLKERIALQATIDSIKSDVWGYTEGSLNDCAFGTLGGRWLVLLRAIFGFKGGPVDVASLSPDSAKFKEQTRAAARPKVPDHLEMHEVDGLAGLRSQLAAYPAVYRQVTEQLAIQKRARERAQAINLRLDELNQDALTP